MNSRKCINDPNSFCYICGVYILEKQSRRITDFVRNVYYSYFGIKLGDQDKPWAPHSACRSCIESLRKWSQGKKKNLAFGIPMIWREPKNHSDDCYFCTCQIKGHNKKSIKNIYYPNIHSAIRPIPHDSDVPIPPTPTVIANICQVSESNDSNEESSEPGEYNDRCYFNQEELNDLVRDLNLNKEESELLGSRLKEKNMLAPETTFYWYRHREKEFTTYFSQENTLVYCNNLSGLMNGLGVETYNACEWRLFIDSSKYSLKGVLLHNGGYSPVPIAYSSHLKENYENIDFMLNKISYSNHQWQICSDLKVIGMLLGLQPGNTKMPCFMCEWDSRARDLHWKNTLWPCRTDLKPGSKNVIHSNLIDPNKVILPPLHIKLGLIKQFVKSLNQNSEAFKYLSNKFPHITYNKIKEGIFVGPQIRKLIEDKEFEKTMTDIEKAAWLGFKNVVHNFLGNKKDPQFKKIVEDMLLSYEKLGCKMSLKVHFLKSHLDYFPENLGRVSEEQGERFHKDIQQIENRYKGKLNTNMIADYLWLIKRDFSLRKDNRRKSLKRSFKM
jgi:hypothetical protein